MGVRIGHLSEIAPEIFRVCNGSSWEELRGEHLVIDLSQRSCITVRDPTLTNSDLVIVCALGPLIETLQFDLLNEPAKSDRHSGPLRSNEMRSRKRGGE